MLGTAALTTLSSCLKDLDRDPVYDPGVDTVYKDAAGYKQALAKIYGGFALTGSQGPSGTGTGDIQNIDEGTSDYLRQLWSAQELTTDEAVIAWGDVGIQDWHNMNWTAANPLIRGLYSRIFYEITLCNGFLQQATDAKLSERGLSGNEATAVRAYRAEARFIRALSYYHALDLFGKAPFTDENFEIGGFTAPSVRSGPELFAFIESELKAIEPDLLPARTNEYGRADKAAAWTLLARLYLNSRVYNGASSPSRLADCATYAKRVIDAGYSLQTTPAAVSSAYGRNFLADNQTSPEIIFAVPFDGKRTQSYGGTTFLVHAAIAGTADENWKPSRYGVGAGWGGIRTTSNLYSLFRDTAADRRGRFQTQGQTLEITSLTDFKYGYVPIKYKNVTSTGVAGSDGLFVDTDYPLFRLADVYLMYAEAVTREASAGDATLALNYVNQIRNRAFNNASGATISAGALNSDFILQERARELYWEGYRRTDLIRFGRFTDASYLWPWKGGVATGRVVESFRNLFPIPTSELGVNPNLQQNPGY